MNQKAEKNLGWSYVLAAYITFVVMVLGICGCASMVFHASPLVMRILSNLCAWSPTIVLFVGFKKWGQGKTIKEFLIEVFSGKIKMCLILTVYCILKIPTIAEGNPKSCMRNFPIVANAFGISLCPQ